MTDPNLLTYIKQNLTAGFPETDIRQTLITAGWERTAVDEAFNVAKPVPTQAGVPVKNTYVSEPPARETRNPAAIPADIQDSGLVAPESYLQKHYKMMALIAGIIIVTPFIIYGAYWSYQRLSTAKTQEIINPAPAETSGESLSGQGLKSEETLRDEQRLADVRTLQTALSAFFTAKQNYPQALSELVPSTTLPVIPADPKTKQPYLYIPVGNPAADFSLSFVLESKVGALDKGLHEISPGHFLPVDENKQGSEVRGATAAAPAPELKITDLSKKPFYPGETTILNITSASDLEYAVMVIGSLKLTDRSAPFGFEFSAPLAGGSYEVSVYAFTRDGQSLRGTTKLIVQGKK